MGLREKVALAMLVSFSTQIVCNQCLPRGHSNYPLKSYGKKIKSPENSANDRAIRSNFTTFSDSEGIRFPNVEYPSDPQPGEYYRFLNDYPIQFQTENCANNVSPQARSHERQAKCKRKYNMAANIKNRPEVMTSLTEYDPPLQPYCFRKSPYFPEVEYPLSARDMWIPNYWNRLQDAKRNNNVETNIPSQNYDMDYENSPLSTLIKTLNTNKTLAKTPNSDIHCKPPNQKEVDSFLGELTSTSSVFNSDIDPEMSIAKKGSLDNIACNKTTTNMEINHPELSILANNNVSTTTSTTNCEIKPEPPLSEKNLLSNIQTNTTKTKTSDVIPELSNVRKDTGILDNIVPTSTSMTNSDIKPESPSSNKNQRGDILPTMSNTEVNDIITTLPICSEDKGSLDNIVSIITNATNSDVKPESPISEKCQLSNIQTDTAKTQNSSIIPELPKVQHDTGLLNSFVPTTSSATNSDIKYESLTSNKNQNGDFVTTTSNMEHNDIITKLPIFSEDKDPLDNIFSTPASTTNNEIKPESSISEKYQLSNILMNTTKTENSSIIPELPILQEHTGLLDNILPTTTSMSNSDIKHGLPSSNKIQHSDIVTATSKTEDGGMITKLPIFSEDKGLVDSFLSATTSTTNDDIKSESPISKSDQLSDIFTYTAMIEPSNIHSELPLLPKDSGHIIPTATSTTNSDIKPKSPSTNEERHSNIITTTLNTKENSIITKLSVFNEDNCTTVGTTKEAEGSPSDTHSMSTSSIVTPNDAKLTIPTATLKTNDKTATDCLPIIDTTTESITNIFTPSYHSDITTSMTTTTPFEYIKTSSISGSGTLSDDVLLSQSEKAISSQLASSTTNYVLTTPSPSSNKIQPMVSNNYNDSLTAANYDSLSLIDIGLSNFNKDWVSSPNGSFTTWESVPEYVDDWIIYVDTENTLQSSGNISDKTLTENEDMFAQDLVATEFDPVYFVVDSSINEGPVSEASLNAVDIIVYIEDPNSNLQYEYIDDTLTSYTEMPYDLILGPEFTNDTWSAFTNDSYVLYQPTNEYSDDSDDTFLLFVDTNDTISWDDII